MGTGKNPPLVSVILPFYNAPFLENAIQSILNQSYENFELILVDNGSNDESEFIAKSYHSHPKVKLVSETNRGVVYAFNTGLKFANGPYIARMDADDIATEDRLVRQVDLLESDSSLEVVSGLVEYLGPDENIGFIHYVDWLNSIRSTDQIRFNQFVEFPLANPSLMFRRKVFDKYGSYQAGDFPEDYEFFLRLMSKSVTMRKVEHTILKWRDLSGRLTRTDDRYSQEAFFKIKAQYLAQWLKKNNPFHPNIYLWGAGRLSRRRSELLLAEGVEVMKYIDVKKKDEVLHYTNTPSKEEAFIVSYVANRGARNEIRDYLNKKGYIEEANFILAS
ncbi:glycosyltransferase [Ekhidna sp.]|uniref:glycosyltransferase n=1 Tax=Ekhidna sp. TaxID=2608089 RepID=UPI003B50F66D